jgi:conjugal transfer pilus assembly protein TraB
METSLKNKKIQIMRGIIAIASLFGLVLFGLWVTAPKNEETQKQTSDKLKDEITKQYKISSQDALNSEENWINKSETKLKEMSKENETLKNDLSSLKKQMLEMSAQKISDQVEETQAAPKKDLGTLSLPLPNPKASGSMVLETPSAPMGEGSLPMPDKEIFSVNLDQPQKDKDDGKNIENYIPAGAFSKIILLSGIDAPTGDLAKSDPLPVLMKVQDEAQLPNKFRGKIKECLVVGAAQGSMSAERGYIRLEKLSCVLSDKKIIEAKITGFVAGEDGKAGFRGTVVSKQGSLIAKAALAGVFAGMGEAISAQYQMVSQTALGTVTTMDPKKVAESGLAKGTSNALEKIADFYIARANETFPIIEVDAGRRGEIVLTAGTSLEYKLGEIKQ